MPLPLIAAVAGVSALAKGVSGLLQKSSANKIAKNNPFPTAYVQPEYQQNVAQAEQMAQVGLPQQQYNNQVNNIYRNQSAGLSTLSRSANPGTGIASIVRAGNDATNQLNGQDAAARMQNMFRLMQQRQVLAGQRQNVWDWNNKQKYLTNLEREQALRGAGNQNLMGAFGDLTNGAAQIAGMQMYGGQQQGQTGGLMMQPQTNLGSPLYRQQYNQMYGNNPNV